MTIAAEYAFVVVFPFFACSMYKIVCTLQPTNPLKTPRPWESAVILYSLTAQVLFFFVRVIFCYPISLFLLFFFCSLISLPLSSSPPGVQNSSLTQNFATSCGLPTISISFWSFHSLKENSVNFILFSKCLNAFFSNPYPSFLNAGCAIICPAWFPTSCGGDRRVYRLSGVLCVLVTYSWEVLSARVQDVSAWTNCRHHLKSFSLEKVKHCSD